MTWIDIGAVVWVDSWFHQLWLRWCRKHRWCDSTKRRGEERLANIRLHYGMSTHTNSQSKSNVSSGQLYLPWRFETRMTLLSEGEGWECAASNLLSKQVCVFDSSFNSTSFIQTDSSGIKNTNTIKAHNKQNTIPSQKRNRFQVEIGTVK